MSNKNVERDQDVSLKLFIVLSRAFEAIEKQIVKNVKEYGLNLTEFAVLELLFHKGDQPIQKVGQKFCWPPVALPMLLINWRIKVI